MARYDELEARVGQLMLQLEREFADLGDQQRWLLSRAFVHRAVHYATERPGVEFCALATYLAEMVGHAHKLAHGDNPASHGDVVH